MYVIISSISVITVIMIVIIGMITYFTEFMMTPRAGPEAFVMYMFELLSSRLIKLNYKLMACIVMCLVVSY